jgi:hypothetical protein
MNLRVNYWLWPGAEDRATLGSDPSAVFRTLYQVGEGSLERGCPSSCPTWVEKQSDKSIRKCSQLSPSSRHLRLNNNSALPEKDHLTISPLTQKPFIAQMRESIFRSIAQKTH